MPYLSLGEKTLYYESYGTQQEKALLYLHGGPGASCLDFRRQAEAISQTCRVVCADQYGVLRSDAIAPAEPYGMALQVSQFEQMREQLGLKSWSLLGHSYGGMLACLYANLHPTSVDAVIYDCPSFDFYDSAKSSARYLRAYYERAQMAAGVALCRAIEEKVYAPREAAVVWDLISALSLAADQPEVRNYLHNITYAEYSACCDAAEIPDALWGKSETHLRKLVEDGAMLDDFRSLLRENRQPALLLTGRYDPVCSSGQIDFFERFAPAGHRREFARSGHFPRLEEAEAYTECVRAFLTQYA